jgi:hypothetical protein
LRPRARIELADGLMQDFFGEGARIRVEFPGIAKVERAAAFVTIEAGAMTAEKRALRVFGIFEPGAAAETDVEFREDAGEAHGPDAEVGDGAPGGSGLARAQVVEDGGEEAEIFFAGLGGGEHLFGDFGEEVEGAGGGEIAEDGELGMHEFAGIKVHEFAVFAMKVRHFDVRKAFEARAKAAFRTPGALGDATQLAEVAGEKADDEIAFPKRPGLQHEGFAHASGHSTEMK